MTLADHDLCEEVHNGIRRLVGVNLGEDVARIARRAARLARNKPEHPAPRAIQRVIVFPYTLISL